MSLRFPRTIAALFAMTLIAAPMETFASDTVRIGYQRSSTLMGLIRDSGVLDDRLAQQGVDIRWHEFTSGLPMLEALNLGDLDLSADVADTVPIFAQAANVDLTFYATEAPSPAGQAMIVHADSSIDSVADLKGKRVTVTRGAGNHYLLLAALNRAGLTLDDVQVSYLTPSDARAAFVQKNVDAWIAWEPYLSTARAQDDTRTIVDGSDGLANYTRFYLAATPYAESHPEVVGTVYRTLKEAGDWVRAHRHEAAQRLSPLWGGIDPKIIEAALSNRSYQVEPVSKAQFDEQQQIVDAFLEAGVLPRKVDTRDAHIYEPTNEEQ
ncbi:aliphatic sulfonate ABC transporter substrate-binding protein [Salinicola corii]|uniref:Putative aliphatic sulfonates-binding protein n=1 Tax=Salinicola corii TaxID=2606937 RepID=A0A640WB72_9GAMM|nr:aliphatic sulfonate ABC transporter substrate-binding protein [Salinicola corii]KAA0017492.1 aliphatic sulfonate ABC transporter substrate-binding protein [Salinicola corii]